eukprot:jgi/Chlat1/8176/Chrsp76S07653
MKLMAAELGAGAGAAEGVLSRLAHAASGMAIWPELPVLLLGELVQAESRLRKLLLPAEPVLVGNVEFEEYATQVLKLAPERRRPLLVRAFDPGWSSKACGTLPGRCTEVWCDEITEALLARWRLACLSTNRVETVEHLETLAKDCPAASTAARSALRRILHAEAATARAQAASIRASYAGSTAMKQRKKAADDAQAALHAAEQLILERHPTSHAAAEGIAKANLQSAYAAGALYWNGRIEKKRGHDRQAARWWRRALASHPQSYYGWSAAACLQPGLSAALSIAGEAVSAQSMISAQQQQQTAGSRMLITDISTVAFASTTTTTIGSRAKSFFLRRRNLDNAPLPVNTKLHGSIGTGTSLGDTHVGLMELASAMARANTPLERRLCKQLEKCQGFLRAVYPLPRGIQDDSKQSVSWDRVAYWSKQYNVDPLLVMAVIRQESQFNAKAMSHVGARGLMQLMPETAKWIAECARVPSYDLMNAADSVRLGSWYVAWVSGLYGGNNLVPAIAAYNAGPGLVDDWLSRSKAMEWDEFVEQLPFGETKYYVKSVLGAYWTYHRLYNNGERGRRLRAALARNKFLGVF